MSALIKTLTVKLSDAEIQRNAKLEHVRDLRDASHPSLHFRFAKNRARGSWYLLNKRRWHRIGGFPDLSTKQVVAALPAVRLRVAANGAASVSGWVTVGELLDWFADRMSRSRALSDKRRSAGKSAISCQLKPRLGDLLICDVNAQTLDKLLMWPAQEELSLSYVQQLYRLLAVAFRQARKLDLIPANPMAELKFINFTTARILPKPARLRDVQLPELVEQLTERFERAPGDAMLALMMLCHGTATFRAAPCSRSCRAWGPPNSGVAIRPMPQRASAASARATRSASSVVRWMARKGYGSARPWRMAMR